MSIGKRNAAAQAEIDIVTAVSPSLVERFGLFTIIVLGEVVVGVVGGVTAGVSRHYHLSWLVGGTAALGTLIAIALWWVYFDFVSHRLPRQSTAMVSVWFYLHLPLTMGIASVGAAVLNVVEHAGEHLPPEVRWLLVGAIAVTLVCTAGLMRTIRLSPEHQRTHQAGRRVMLVSAVLILLLGFLNLDIIPSLIFLACLMLAPIFSAFRVWIEMLE